MTEPEDPPPPNADAPHTAAMSSETKAMWEEKAARLIGGLSLFALGTGTIVYHALEDWSWVDSFYFSAVALTTVGFGDLSPSTDVSKLFTVFYIFSGISLIGATLNELAKRHARRMNARAKRSSGT